MPVPAPLPVPVQDQDHALKEMEAFDRNEEFMQKQKEFMEQL